MSEEERRRGRAEEVKGETEWKMKGKHGKDESVRKIRKGIKRVASFQVDKMHCPSSATCPERNSKRCPPGPTHEPNRTRSGILVSGEIQAT